MTDTSPPPPAGVPAHLEAVRRHVTDLHEGTHAGQHAREDKEAAFETTVALLDPVVRRALAEVDEVLLGGRATTTATGVEPTADGGLAATWRLRWPELDERGARALAVVAHFEQAFLHPHLRGASLGEWPLNVHSAADAEAQLPVVRAIVAGDLHDLVFEEDHTVVPADTSPNRP